MNFGLTMWIVFSTHVRRMVRSKRMLLMLAAAMLPAVPIFLIGLRSGDARQVLALTNVTWFLVFQVVAPVIALIGGTAAVAEEVVDGTINWVLVRPVSRPAFFLARWLAVLLPVLLVGTVLVAAMVICSPGPRHVTLELMSPTWRTLMVGLVAYTTVFAAIGAWFKRPVIAGLGYAFAMEALLANLPGTTPELSVVHLLRSLVASAGGAWMDIVTKTRLKVISGDDAMEQLLWLTAICLIIGCIATRRRQFGLTVG